MPDLNVRSWRNHNPLNVISISPPWAGQLGTDASFAVFSSAVYGWRAAFENLEAYKLKHGIDTIQGIVARWAPEADGNDDPGYAALVSRITGIDETATVDLQDWETLLAIGSAMAVVEGGKLPWVETDKEKGLKMAGIHQKPAHHSHRRSKKEAAQ